MCVLSTELNNYLLYRNGSVPFGSVELEAGLGCELDEAVALLPPCELSYSITS